MHLGFFWQPKVRDNVQHIVDWKHHDERCDVLVRRQIESRIAALPEKRFGVDRLVACVPLSHRDPTRLLRHPLVEMKPSERVLC